MTIHIAQDAPQRAIQPLAKHRDGQLISSKHHERIRARVVIGEFRATQPRIIRPSIQLHFHLTVSRAPRVLCGLSGTIRIAPPRRVDPLGNGL